MPGSATISWLSVPLSGIQEVQNKSYASSADSATHTITLNTTPVNGNLLILCANADWFLTTPSGWILAATTSSFVVGALYYKIAGASEPTSIAVTQSGVSSMALYVMEYSGMAASPFDIPAFSVNVGPPNSTGTTGTTAQADELLIAVANFAPDTDNTIVSWSNSFTQVASLKPSVGTGLRMGVAKRVVSATGAYGTAATAVDAAGAGYHHGLIATFKIAA